jgi:NUMOD4 motif/HNH endonuclease
VTDLTERWLPVAGYETLYEVSSLGQVRSLRRKTRSGMRGGRILKPFIRPDGYPEVALCRDGISEKRFVHHLVLEAFDKPCPDGEEARHGPGGKADASITNLCWGTRAQNVGPDRVRDGQANRGERHGRSKLTAEQVEDIRRRAAARETQQSIADRYEITISNVSSIVLGKTWSYPGVTPLSDGETRHRRGATNPRAKLTEADVKKIRMLYAIGTPQKNLAQRFGVSQANISSIVNRKSW